MPTILDTVDLLASYWTVAGNVRPLSGNDVSPVDIRKRVEAAAAAGFRGFGLVHADLMKAIRTMGVAGLRALMQDNGIIHIELEMLNDWYTDGTSRWASDHVRMDLLSAAEALGARHIKAGAQIGGTAWPLDKVIREFQRLCQQASSAGTRIALEPMPFSHIRSLDTALKILTGAGNEAGGLMLDAWHVLRGGQALDAVARLPKQWVCAVELNDADAAGVGSMIEDTLERRRLCGEGDLDLAGFINAVQATGYEGPWGVEILSAEHRRRSVTSQARLAYISTMWQLHATLVGTAPSRPA